MSRGTKIKCDTEVILSKFESLNVKSMTSVHKAAFSNANKVLVKEARLQLQGVTARATTGWTARKKGWSKVSSLDRGIRSKVSANGDRGMVHIMGDFRLKWFEMGTTDRYRQGDIFTGRMTRRPFFAKAVTTAERAMADAFENTIAKAVERRVK